MLLGGRWRKWGEYEVGEEEPACVADRTHEVPPHPTDIHDKEDNDPYSHDINELLCFWVTQVEDESFVLTKFVHFFHVSLQEEHAESNQELQNEQEARSFFFRDQEVVSDHAYDDDGHDHVLLLGDLDTKQNEDCVRNPVDNRLHFFIYPLQGLEELHQ